MCLSTASSKNRHNDNSFLYANAGITMKYDIIVSGNKLMGFVNWTFDGFYPKSYCWKKYIFKMG